MMHNISRLRVFKSKDSGRKMQRIHEGPPNGEILKQHFPGSTKKKIYLWLRPVYVAESNPSQPGNGSTSGRRFFSF